MTTQLQTRIDISNVVVDRSHNIVYKDEERETHIPEFARQRLKHASSGGKIQIGSPGVPSSGAPVIKQANAGALSLASDHEVKRGTVAAARQSFLNKSPEPESVASTESVTSNASTKAGTSIAKQAASNFSKSNAQTFFFGMPPPDTQYQKPKLPSKTQTQSTTSSTRDGIKTTKTKTITTERFPTDQHDKAAHLVSREVVKIDENTEDEISKTSKILGGMQYNITTVIRSIKEHEEMETPKAQKWSKESPSPRNMPDVMKVAQKKEKPVPAAPTNGNIAQSKNIPVSNNEDTQEPSNESMRVAQKKFNSESTRNVNLPDILRVAQKKKPQNKPQQSHHTPPVRKDSKLGIREAIPTSNTDRAAISNRLENIFGRNQQLPSPLPSQPPPKRKQFGESSGKGAISNQLEQILGRNQQASQAPELAKLAPQPPPKRKEFEGHDKHAISTISNSLEKMMLARNQQTPENVPHPPHRQAKPLPSPPTSNQKADSAKAVQKGAVTNQLEQMFAKRSQEAPVEAKAQQKQASPTVMSTTRATGSPPSSKQKGTSVKALQKGAVTNQLEQMFAKRSQEAAPVEAKAPEKPVVTQQKHASPMEMSRSIDSADKAQVEPSVNVKEAPVVPAPAPSHAAKPSIVPIPDVKSKEIVPPIEQQQGGEIAASATSTTPSTLGNMGPTSSTADAKELGPRIVQKTTVTKTVTTTITRQKVPKDQTRDSEGIRDGGTKAKPPTSVGFCCTIM